MPKKRGRPRKVPVDPVPFDGNVAVMEEAAIYSPAYSGRMWWFLGIKVDHDKSQLPFHNRAFGGKMFQQGTQRQVVTENVWLSLDSHRTRVVRQLLSAAEVIKMIASIKQFVVRWHRRSHTVAKGDLVTRWAADVVSLEHRIKTYDMKEKKFVPSGYRYQFQGLSDVPVASYLVLVPRSYINDPSAGKVTELDISGLPSILDLDPSMIPDRIRDKDPAAGGDEVW